MSKFVVAVLTAFFFSGCGSYRMGAKVDGNRSMAGLQNRYRIGKITFSVPLKKNHVYGGEVADYNAPQQTGSMMDEDRIRDFCELRYPDVFVADDKGIPIDIAVESSSPNKEYEWSILFPYILSLGILPAWIETTSTAKISITVSGEQVSDSSVAYVSNSKVTCFSPIGIIPYSRDIDMDHVETAECALGFSNPKMEMRKTSEAVFLNSFCDGILISLSKYESSRR